MHTNLSRGIDRWIDKVQEDMFYGGNVRSWLEYSCFLPSPDYDVIFVFLIFCSICFGRYWFETDM